MFMIINFDNSLHSENEIGIPDRVTHYQTLGNSQLYSNLVGQ